MTKNEEVVGLVTKVEVESSGFQSQITELGRKMKVIQSEYKATSSASKDFDKTFDGLTAKSKYLSDAITVQQKIVDQYGNKIEASKEKLEGLLKKQEDLSQKLNSTKAAYEESVKLHGKDAEETKKLEEEVAKLSKQYKNNESEISKTNKSIDNQTITCNNAKSSLNNYKNQLSETEQEMSKMKSSSDNVSAGMNGLNGIGNPFEMFTGGVKDALSQTNLFGINLGELGGALTGAINPTALLEGAVMGLTSKLTELAVQALEKCIQKIGEFIKSSMELGEQFERQMSRVEALSGASSTELDDLTDTAREMGSATIYSAKQAAEALEYMALAGWDAEESAQGLPTILNLAAASAMELGEASDIVTDYLTAFNMSVEESARLADVMCYAQSNSNTTTQLLGESYKNCASTCASFGMEVEESTAWLGKWADAGRKGGEAGSSFNAILARMYGQNKKTTEAMAEYGISCFDAAGKARNFTDVVEDMQNATSKMTDEQRDFFARNVAGTNQLAAFNSMMSISAKEVRKFTEELKNASGESERQAKIMADNIYGLKASINSKIEDIKLSISTAFAPLQSMVLKVFETMLNGITRVLKPIGDFIGANISILQTIFNCVMDIIQVLQDTLIPIIEGPLTVLTSILRGIGLVVSEICTGIKDVAGLFTDTLKPQIDEFKEEGKVILAVFEAIAHKVKQIFDFIKNLIKLFVEGMPSFYNEIYALFNLNFEELKKEEKKQQELINNTFKSFFAIFGVELAKTEEAKDKIESNVKSIAEVCGLSADHIWGSFMEMYESIQELDSQTYGQLKASANEFRKQYESTMDAMDLYEKDMLNKKLEKWEETHKGMANTKTWYLRRAEYVAKEEQRLSLETASTRESINRKYTKELEKEFKKQQTIQNDNISNNSDKYSKDYDEFAKYEESKTKKLKSELDKRSKVYETWSTQMKGSNGEYTATVAGLSNWYDDKGFFGKLRGYAVGTNNHPGGLSIVGENGPEIRNIPRGSTIATNNDSKAMLAAANKGTEDKLVALIDEVRSLRTQMLNMQQQDVALIGMGV